MKTYKITVNGTEYDVVVEETNGVGTPSSAPVKKAAPKAAQKAAAAPASGSQGSIKVNAPMPGKVLAIKKNVGDAVKKGDVVLIIEAMKMENEIVAPEDGTVASINAAEGAMVEAGSVLATLN